MEPQGSPTELFFICKYLLIILRETECRRQGKLEEKDSEDTWIFFTGASSVSSLVCYGCASMTPGGRGSGHGHSPPASPPGSRAHPACGPHRPRSSLPPARPPADTGGRGVTKHPSYGKMGWGRRQQRRGCFLMAEAMLPLTAASRDLTDTSLVPTACLSHVGWHLTAVRLPDALGAVESPVGDQRLSRPTLETDGQDGGRGGHV